MKKKWLEQVFFSVTDFGAIRILDALITLLIIRTFTASEFGIFAIYQSWVALLLILVPAIELKLFREYGKLKSSGALASELGAYRRFNQIKLLISIALAFGVAHFLGRSNGYGFSTRLAFASLAVALPMAQALYGIYREPLRFELMQRTTTLLGIVQRSILLGLLYGVTRSNPGQIAIFCWVAVIFFYIFSSVWRKVAERAITYGAPKNTTKVIVGTLGATVLWIHLNGVLTGFVQTLDTWFLSQAHIPVEEIAVYSVALKAANFFQILPVGLIAVFGIYLGVKSNEANEVRERKMRNQFFLAFVALGIVLMFAGIKLAPPLLKFLAKGKFPQDALLRAEVYFKWQLAGILIWCTTHPISAFLGARRDLKTMFVRVFAPWTILSGAIYGLAAFKGGATFGPYLAARSNVLVYSLFLTLLILADASGGPKYRGTSKT